ncbi:MAG: tetraprenyl-beta-curcumene synthase family protein [Clostridia bacterium]|nr:MAG: tetraprenyl-beta-curcumene synthase family protein [Clostridia bacterium]
MDFTATRVLRLPGQWRQVATLAAFIGQALPQVNRELREWEQQARACPDAQLRYQALASQQSKKFHCQGGSIFATQIPTPYRPRLLRAIVALQTISDYLDNLCDRAGVQDAAAFAQLHQAFMDAIDPQALPSDYYSCYPYREDGGYLERLVRTCQEILATFPAYSQVQAEVTRLGGYYCRLQVAKHLDPSVRESKLQEWLEPLRGELYWWELAAACGSTLGIFAMLHLAAWPDLESATASQVAQAYFPWIAALHILLDYYIDQEEDRAGGDLNFAAYYSSPEEAAARLQSLFRASFAAARQLPDPWLHEMVVKGLLAMYLSDAKAGSPALTTASQGILQRAGSCCHLLYRLCRALRRVKVI